MIRCAGVDCMNELKRAGVVAPVEGKLTGERSVPLAAEAPPFVGTPHARWALPAL